MRMNLKGLTAPLVKSIIFVFVTGLATLMLAVMVAGAEFDSRTTYHAIFTDVTGLNPGDSVRVAGVRVGQVDAIDLHQRRLARVSFSVEQGRRIPGTATAAIKYLNLVGQRYIDLRQGAGTPGQAPASVLRPNGVIPKEQTHAALNLTELFRGFRPLMQALSPKDVNKLSGEIIQVLQGEGGTVESLLQTIGSLTTTLAGKDKLIGEVISNLSKVADTVNSRSKELTKLVKTLQELISGLADDRKPIGEAVEALGELSSATADLLRGARKPLKDSIHELGRLTANLDKDSPLVETFLRNSPRKMSSIGKLASYGSWSNFFLCQATVTGVRYADDRPPPQGVIVDYTRCKG